MRTYGREMVYYLSVAALTLGLATTAATAKEASLAKATFAGGCFWCMEPPYDKLDGVISTTSGYTGGHQPDPTYEDVSAGLTGHTEAIEILYDPGKVTYQELLKVYWRNTDPTTADRQFCDKGNQYRPGIFYHNQEQKRLAELSKQDVERMKRFPEAIVTEITVVTEFYPAEEYHQDFYLKNPVHYKFYRFACGRDNRLHELWGTNGASG